MPSSKIYHLNFSQTMEDGGVDTTVIELAAQDLPNGQLSSPLTCFHENEAIKKKKSKWPTKKKLIFQNCQFSIFFHENFMDWFFG